MEDRFHARVELDSFHVSLVNGLWAELQFAGTYRLSDGALNFTGTAKMESSILKMVGGWKGMLFAPADHLFKRDGAGSEVPIHIEGTREEPKFGIDFERLLPGEKR